MTEEMNEPVIDTCSGIPLNITLKYTGGCWNSVFPLPALPGAGEEGLGKTHRPVLHAEWNEQNLAGSGWVHTVHWPDILKSEHTPKLILSCQYLELLYVHIIHNFTSFLIPTSKQPPFWKSSEMFYPYCY